jgi:thiol-disulfide isomerase/thioredoxin
VLDNKPAANLEIVSRDAEQTMPIAGEPRIAVRYYLKTDPNGRFEFRRVMPGRLQLTRRVTNGVERRAWYINLATVDVVNGQTYDLAIGRSGRRIAGRLEIPTSDVWMIRKAEIVARNGSDKPPVSIGVEVLDDGRFQAQDLRPGDYRLQIALHEPPPSNACGWGRLIAAFDHDFSVTGTADDSPLDLGSVRPAKRSGRALEVGDAAPELVAKTLDGNDLNLRDFRGKFVLLDFWATWCAPCLAEMPHLNAVQQEFGSDPRFALISVNLDETPALAASYVKSKKFAWRHGHISLESPAVAAYGATAIPATFLIGPDGSIVGKDLRGEKLKAAIAAALSSGPNPGR